MTDKIIAEFTANGTRIQLIAHEGGRGGYTVFTRVLNNLDLDDVDCYSKNQHAFAKFLLLTNRILLNNLQQ